jgi:transposase-like protein
MATLKTPRTLQQAIVFFADPENAFNYAVSLRWPDGKVFCPRCGSEKHSFINAKKRKLWFCYNCKKQFTVKVKTIFEDSAITLDKWMIAVWMLVSCKNGISSYELGKTIGVTQRTAWFMNQRIRKALHRGSFGTTKLGGGNLDSEVEVDETFVGGLTKNMHKDRKLSLVRKGGVHGGKTVVQGILDRNLRQIRASVLPDVKRETLQNEVLKNVKYGTRVYSDNAVGYECFDDRFVHQFVNHAEKYVDGRVHTNGLENFWSLLKRGLRGTYVAVEPFHLFRYVDEQVFCYNNRKNMSDAQRFALAMSQIGGKRLTYAELTGKDADALHSPTTGARETQVPF